MGCFPACFGHWKQKGTVKNVQDKSSSSGHELDEAVKLLSASTESTEEEEIGSPTKLVSQSQAQNEENKSSCNGKKSDGYNVDAGDGNDLTGSLTGDNLVENEGNGNAGNKRGEGKDDASLTPDAAANQGHENFLIIAKECAAVNSKEVTVDDNPNGGGTWDCCGAPPESSESLFSLSIDSRKQVSTAEKEDKEVCSVLKPSDRGNTSFRSENTVHFLAKTSDDSSVECGEDKENVNLEERWIMSLNKELMLKQSVGKWKPRGKEIALDTSLSSWLIESEKMPSPHNTSAGNSAESEKFDGDGQILGPIITPAVEIKQLKGCSAAGSAACCNAEDQPGMGTVGRFWQHTGSRLS